MSETGKVRSAKWYAENKDTQYRWVNARRQKLKLKVRDYKQGKSCVRCGFDDPRALQFHHLDPATKLVSLSLAHMKGWGWPKIQTEIDKCVLLCANCHAIEHSSYEPDASKVF